MATEGRPPSTVFRYTIDDRDRIVDVNDAWLEFARGNDAPELTREAVTGQVLWTYVAGDETRRLYEILLATVRERDTPLIIPFRCDSPTMRRDMRLVISPLHAGRVSLEGVLVSATPQPYLAVLNRGVPRSGAKLPICSCCRRAWIDGGEWLELEEIVVRMALFSEPRPPALSESLCPACLTILCGAAGGDA